MKTVIVDTNVILVANEQHAGVRDACVTECATRLLAIKDGGRIAIDDGYLILGEYQNKTAPHAGKRAGDAFLKWVLQNNANPKRCDKVSIATHEDRSFEAFPEDEALAKFDRSDRKFVAVAAAHAGKPPILQAADSKWVGWAPALKTSGVIVEFLCPADIQRFDDKKKGVVSKASKKAIASKATKNAASKKAASRKSAAKKRAARKAPR